MIWSIVGIVLAFGVVLIGWRRWAGWIAAIVASAMMFALYGYPTSSLFLPDDFYLLAVHGNSVWIEVEGAPAARAVALPSVPEEWREALDGSGGKPVRIMRAPEEPPPGTELQPAQRGLADYLATDTEEYQIVEQYRMSKQ